MRIRTSTYSDFLKNLKDEWGGNIHQHLIGFDREHELAIVHLAIRDHPSNRKKQDYKSKAEFLDKLSKVLHDPLFASEGVVVTQFTTHVAEFVIGLGRNEAIEIIEAVRICSRMIQNLRIESTKEIEADKSMYTVSAGVCIDKLACGFLSDLQPPVLTVLGPALELSKAYSRSARAWQIGLAPGLSEMVLEQLNELVPTIRPNVIEAESAEAPLNEEDFLDVALIQSEEDFGFVALELGDGDSWSSLLPLPDWYTNLMSAERRKADQKIQVSGLFDFLDNFLIDAQVFWNTKNKGSLRSGSWEEKSAHGEALRLEASALSFAEKRILMIEKAGRRIEEKISVLQRFRESELELSRLVADLERRSLILRCIVHDLASPLAGVQAALSLLTSENLSEEGREFLQMSMKQSNRVSMQIREILDVVTAGILEFDPELVTTFSAPNILETAKAVVSGLKPLAVLHGVEIQLDHKELSSESEKIIAEEKSLTRVFYNLIENAIWHSPSESVIEVIIRSEEDRVWVDVRDSGPGVHPALEDSLFQEFTQLNQHINKIGLGLYFCRTSIESWGGKIGYQKIEGSGSSFWFKVDRFE